MRLKIMPIEKPSRSRPNDTAHQVWCAVDLASDIGLLESSRAIDKGFHSR